MISAGIARKGPAFKPQLRVCYLCGQQFGSKSIGIHIPQCYSKKLLQWENGDPATRGKRPKNPDTVNWQGTGMSMDKLNDEQFHEFAANLVPCKLCGRKFLPDRLPVHLRGCKGDGGKNGAKGSSQMSGTADSSQMSTQRGSTSPSGQRSPRRSPSSSARHPGYKPQLPICYLCGQQFGSSSIAIHVPQCYTKKLAQWEAADVYTRGKPPKHPDTVNWKGDATNVDAHNDAQFAEFVSNLEPCPNCGRKFLADRLVVHLRSCKPGSAAKPVGLQKSDSHSQSSSPSATTNTNSSSNKKNMSDTSNDFTNSGASTEARTQTKTVSTNGRGAVKAADVSGAQHKEKTSEVARLNPKTNRIPKVTKIDTDGRTCARCGAVEYDLCAKYCRDCGANLSSKTLPDPCAKCGEIITEGSRFCATCGVPINGAAASERIAGAENVNAPSTRVLVCPACQAICDADGNFCDNCGAALGDTEPAMPTNSEPKSKSLDVMHCTSCGETVEDLLAKFCEECGEVLQRMDPKKLNSECPGHNLSTLPPEGLKRPSSPVTKTDPVASQLKTSNNVAKALPPLTTPKKAPQCVQRTLPESAQRTAFTELQGELSPATGRGGSGVMPMANKQSPPKVTNAPPTPTTTTHPKKVSLPVEYEEPACEEERGECSHCGRYFVLDILKRHERVCVAQKTRKVFNSSAKRLSGTEAKLLAKSSGMRAASAAPKKDWRAESEAFRRAMRDARKVDMVLKSGGNVKDLPPPTYSENSHYTSCPHCNRKFAPDVAQRHIPHCATTVNKPKPPPKRRLMR